MKMLTTLAIAFALAASSLFAQVKAEAGVASFGAPAEAALKAMKARAEQLHMNGVAIVAFAEGDTVTSWSSRMQVVGNMTQPPSATGKGNNLLGIAYAKMAEMASTLKDSGSGVRHPYTGEYGWRGGVTAKGRTGILFAAFSGGRDDDDLSVAKTGLGILAASL